MADNSKSTEHQGMMDDDGGWSLAISDDKVGRAVSVEVAASVITLEVGGRLGESEWTRLIPDEAREIASALNEAADRAEAER